MSFQVNTDFVYDADNCKTGKVNIAKHEFKAYTDKEWNPPKSERLGVVKKSGKGKPKKSVENPLYLDLEDNNVYVKPYSTKHSIFEKKYGWVRVKNNDTHEEGYIKVVGIKALPIIAMIILACAIILIVYSLLNGVAPQDAPAYFADQTGITNNNEKNKPEAHISYATYQSTPDQTWPAGTKEQAVTLSLPKNVTYTDTDGKQKTEENPVVAAPSIWVDLNHDGKFTNDECVFNPPTYDKDGNVIKAGDLLEPGKQITHITLTKTIPSGKYSAQTLWTPQMADGGSPANPMTFNWNLTVQ